MYRTFWRRCAAGLALSLSLLLPFAAGAAEPYEPDYMATDPEIAAIQADPMGFIAEREAQGRAGDLAFKLAIASIVADMASTVAFLESGNGYEANGLYGSDPNYGLLAGIAVARAGLLYGAYKIDKRMARRGFLIFSVLTFAVAGWNTSIAAGDNDNWAYYTLPAAALPLVVYHFGN